MSPFAFLQFYSALSASRNARELSLIVYMLIIFPWPLPACLCSTLASSAFEPKSVRECGGERVGEAVLHLGSGGDTRGGLGRGKDGSETDD
jgi:hypothetical protein